MLFENFASLSKERFDEIRSEFSSLHSLLDVLKWGRRQPETLPEIIAEVVVQDEFTHDLVVPWKDGLVLVLDAT